MDLIGKCDLPGSVNTNIEGYLLINADQDRPDEVGITQKPGNISAELTVKGQANIIEIYGHDSALVEQPWFNDICAATLDKRENARNEWLNDKSKGNKKFLKKCKKQATKILEQEKRKYKQKLKEEKKAVRKPNIVIRIWRRFTNAMKRDKTNAVDCLDNEQGKCVESTGVVMAVPNGRFGISLSCRPVAAVTTPVDLGEVQRIHADSIDKLFGRKRKSNIPEVVIEWESVTHSITAIPAFEFFKLYYSSCLAKSENTIATTKSVIKVDYTDVVYDVLTRDDYNALSVNWNVTAKRLKSNSNRRVVHSRTFSRTIEVFEKSNKYLQSAQL